MKKRYFISGILGSICFGIGDWLLGYIPTTPVDAEIFYFIRVGHAEMYNTQKVVVTLLLAILGSILLTSGLMHMSDFAKNEKTAKWLRFSGVLCLIGWIILHLNVSLNVAVFSEASKIYGMDAAIELSHRIGNICIPLTYGSMGLIACAFVVLSTEILRGNTYLNKSAIVFVPYITSGIIMCLFVLLPNTPFSYGLYTFNMNAGLLVWFGYITTRKECI